MQSCLIIIICFVSKSYMCLNVRMFTWCVKMHLVVHDILNKADKLPLNARLCVDQL